MRAFAYSNNVHLISDGTLKLVCANAVFQLIFVINNHNHCGLIITCVNALHVLKFCLRNVKKGTFGIQIAATVNANLKDAIIRINGTVGAASVCVILILDLCVRNKVLAFPLTALAALKMNPLTKS